jgi:DNA invertase Pin-like site-specific DNA recombinase
MGKLVLAILGAVAEFESDIRKVRQMEGIERAKANGVYKDRKPSVDVKAVRSLRDQGSALWKLPSGWELAVQAYTGHWEAPQISDYL